MGLIDLSSRVNDMYLKQIAQYLDCTDELQRMGMKG